MVSGRKALLEKAREFGSLARDLFLDEILARSVTFRAIARHLGIEDIWWSEFWRSFYSPNERETLHGFCFCRITSASTLWLQAFQGKNLILCAALPRGRKVGCWI